jgi:amidase
MYETLQRIEDVNPTINAVVSLRNQDDVKYDYDGLMDEARRADELLDAAADAAADDDDTNNYMLSSNDHWLRGIPMAIKDLEDAKGFPTTKGSPLFRTYDNESASSSSSWHFDNAVEDAPYVQRLRNAGAIIIGKTNVPELGMGCHTYNPLFGTTFNPIDTSKAAGGSSGGAGAALASYLFCALDGSDMMGSLRNPAGWNGLYSLRPTVEWMEEVIEEENVDEDCYKVKMPWPMSTIGPMSRCPEDLAMMLQTMMPPQRGTGLSFDAASILDQSDNDLHRFMEGKRIGWLADWGGDYPMESGIRQQCNEALDIFTTVGNNVHIQHIETPPFSSKELWEAWIDIRSHLITNSLYDHIGGDRRDILPILKEQGVKAEVIYEYKRGLELTNEQIHAHLKTVMSWSDCAQDLFCNYDFLALPSSQTYPFDASLDWPKVIAGRKMDTYHRWMEVMVPVTLLGLPCVTIPAATSTQPIGVQIFGPKGSDAKLLKLARWYSRSLKGEG